MNTLVTNLKWNNIAGYLDITCLKFHQYFAITGIAIALSHGPAVNGTRWSRIGPGLKFVLLISLTKE